MKTLDLPYGESTVHLTLPEEAQQLDFSDPPSNVSKNDFVDGLAGLIAKRKGAGTIGIVVADKTRLCGYPKVLPWVTEVLHDKGFSRDCITFYIAYGNHDVQTDEECFAAYGHTYGRYKFIHHDSKESGDFVRLGTTRRGTPVKVRRDIVETDLILTIGTVSHHYFAGYGGGRKLLFPGLAEKNAIYANHSLFLDTRKSCLATQCWPGNLAGNPLAEDLEEVEGFLPNYLSVHAIPDSSGAPCLYRFGSSYQDFVEVCRELDTYFKLALKNRFDMVVASAGGFPKDINMIQAHKSIHNAANLVRDKGTLVIFAECRDGVGSTTFLPYFEEPDRMAAFCSLSENYTGNGGTALAMMEKTQRISIKMVTTLDTDTCRRIGIEKVKLEEARDIIWRHPGSAGVIRNSSMLVTNRIG